MSYANTTIGWGLLPSYKLGALCSAQEILRNSCASLTCSRTLSRAGGEEPFAAVVEPQDAQSERERGQQWMGQYGLYDKLLLDEELRSTSATLEAFYSESNASNIGVLQRAVSGFEQTSEATAQSQEQLAALQSISPANSIEQTLVEVMSVLYSNAASLIAMNDEDEALLRNVALRCPLDDGFGVYMARSALLKLDTLPKNYFNECELVSKPIHEQEKLVGRFNKVFSVYPNPSSGHFTVNYQINELETGTIEVFDLVGKQVFAQPLQQGVETSDLQLNHLSGGTYFLRLQTNGQLRYSDRINIIKL